MDTIVPDEGNCMDLNVLVSLFLMFKQGKSKQLADLAAAL